MYVFDLGATGLKGFRGESVGDGKPGDQGPSGDKGRKGFRGDPGVLPLGNVIGDFKGDIGRRFFWNFTFDQLQSFNNKQNNMWCESIHVYYSLYNTVIR